MRVTAHDQGFVAASPDRTYAVLENVAAYGGWWPGVDAGGNRDAPWLRLERRSAVDLRAEGHRHGVGVVLRLEAPYRGTLEWFLEPFDDGTVVNCILDLVLPGGRVRAERRLRRLRGAIRAGLVALKKALE